MNDFLQNLRNGQNDKQRPQKTRKNYDNSYQFSNPRFQAHSGGGYQNNRNQQHTKKPSSHSHEVNQQQGDDNRVTSLLADAIDNLSNHVEILTNNQENLVRAQEKTAKMLERQVNAVERVLNHLNIAPLKEEKSLKEEKPRREEKPQKNIPAPPKIPVRSAFSSQYVASKQAKASLSSSANAFKKKTDTISVKSPAKIFDVPSSKKTVETIKPTIRKRKKIVEKKSAKSEVPMPNIKKKLIGRDAIMSIIHSMRDEGATFDQVAARLIELGQPTFSGRGEWHAQTIHRLCSK